MYVDKAKAHSLQDRYKNWGMQFLLVCQDAFSPKKMCEKKIAFFALVGLGLSTWPLKSCVSYVSYV